MKYSRHKVRGKAYALPELKFENQPLTSFLGLVVFQRFFTVLRLKVRLTRWALSNNCRFCPISCASNLSAVTA